MRYGLIGEKPPTAIPNGFTTGSRATIMPCTASRLNRSPAFLNGNYRGLNVTIPYKKGRDPVLRYALRNGAGHRQREHACPRRQWPAARL